MSGAPRIFVYTATLAPRDAVSGQAVEHARVLNDMGFETVLVADGIHEFFEGAVMSTEEALRQPAPAGWLVHFGVWSDGLEALLAADDAPKVMVHHNTTPPELLPPGPVQDVCIAAIENLPSIAGAWDAVIVDSAYNMEALRPAGFHEGIVIPPLLPLGSPQPVTTRTHEVMSIGRIAPSKGLDVAVKAVALVDQVLRPGGDVELVIAGSDAGWEAYGNGVRALIARANTPARLPGSLTNADRDALYARCAALLVTSRHEGFCVPLVEAMRYGTPIIAVDVGAIAETLGGGGVLLPNANPRLIAESIAMLLEDDSLALDLSQRAGERAEHFDPERVTTLLQATFRQAFSRPPAGA